MNQIPSSTVHLPDWSTSSLAENLAVWFRREQRDLPWRKERTVYRTVVSEFMLQQTQVASMLPAFDRWMKVFPDFSTLAQAPEEEVLKQWEGLGYYRRARNLHRLARIVVEQGPDSPTDYAFWRSLPGVGDYTAAAITSISFQLPVACVDGNVIRILARLTAEPTEFSDSSKAVRLFTPLAEELLPRESPGLHNEAMMELGATVCHRRRPLCTVCPILENCAAGKKGHPEDFPKIKRATTIARNRHLVLVCRKDQVLLQRADQAVSGRVTGLYEFPEWEQLNPESPPPDTQKIETRTRSITRYRIKESLFSQSSTEPIIAPGLEWIPFSRLSEITMSGPHRKWLNDLLRKKQFTQSPG